MKTGYKTLSLSSLALASLLCGCVDRNHSGGTPSAAAKSPASTGPGSEAPKSAPAALESRAALTNSADKAGYAVGMSIGFNLKRGNFEVNLDELMRGLKDVAEGREPQMSEQQAREAITAYEQQRQRELAATNLMAGAAFLEENKKKDGVKVQPVALPDGTTAEFQYKVLAEGSGEIPLSNDTVSVSYRGTFLNGTEFDNSAKHGGSAKFVANRVVRGWSEALQMMKVGSKWELYVPASLAYGDRPSPRIPAGSTLIFEVELLGIDRPKPLTSDIIRVPSAEEMKAGAKIEVIKAEDAEKMAAAQTNPAATNQIKADKK